MARFLFFLCVLANAGSIRAQKHFYDQKPYIPAKYSYNADSAYTAIISTKETGLKDYDLRDYAEGLAYYHESTLKSGYIYFDWDEAENYLDNLVKKISSQLSIDRTFKVYLVRDDDVNATAQDNGIIYVYIGLLAEIKDEAALVSVLAHEMAHVLNEDVKNSLAARSRQKGKPNLRKAIALCHGNQDFEARADKTGYEAATGLNYDISSSYHTYTKFESDYRWYKSQYSYQDAKWYIALDNLDKDKGIKPDSLEKYLSDHPENAARIAALNAYKASKNGKLSYAGSESVFKDLQQKAKLEQLYLSFKHASYKNCLRDAFYFHLQDKSNTDYIYYIVECLRRMIFINPLIKRKGFLTEDSKEKVFEPDKGILHDLSFISQDTTFLSLLKNDEIYGPAQKPFETYSEAFSYFYKSLVAKNHATAPLEACLYELARGKTNKGLEYLKKLSSDTALVSREFTSSLLYGSTLIELQGNQTDVVFVETPEIYVKDGPRVRYSYIQSDKNFNDLHTSFRSMLNLREGGNLKFVYADQLEDPAEYEKYDCLSDVLRDFKPAREVDFENSARTSSMDENYWKSREANDPFDPEVLCRNKNFFYLEPHYWDLFRTEQIRSLTLVRPFYFKHPLLGTYMYFEIAYFDPVTRRYLYFDQEYLEKSTGANLKKVLEKFRTKLNAIYAN